MTAPHSELHIKSASSTCAEQKEKQRTERNLNMWVQKRTENQAAIRHCENPPFFCHPLIPTHNNHLNWDHIFQHICKWQIQHGCNSQDTSWGALKWNQCPVLTLNNYWHSPITRHPQCSFLRTLQYSLSKTCPSKRGLCLLATLLSQRQRETICFTFFNSFT